VSVRDTRFTSPIDELVTIFCPLTAQPPINAAVRIAKLICRIIRFLAFVKSFPQRILPHFRPSLKQHDLPWPHSSTHYRPITIAHVTNDYQKALQPSNLRVWFIHDWITGYRGGEKVLQELITLFPNSRIATLLHIRDTTTEEIDERVMQVSFLQKLPNLEKGYRNYLPLFPKAVRSLKLDNDCDLIISSSHAVAKGIRVPRRPDGTRIPHICYCHSPMRYIWDMEDHYVSRFSVKSAALNLVKPYLRRFDKKNEQVDAFVANSNTIVERIRRIYNREAVAVYPGADHHYYVLPKNPSKPREDFYLIVSALVPYKRVDIAVKAFTEMTDKRLVVIGKGPEMERLKTLAAGAKNIDLLGYQPDDLARDHYQRTRGFLFPGLEDFGMTPVEAQMCGAPVVAYAAGGATETVVDQKTGIFINEQTVPALKAGIEKLEAQTFDPHALRQLALRFTWDHFRAGIMNVVTNVLNTSTSASAVKE
jgi:glycosyltransferase involved in cell wall biosynthesis